MANGTMSIDTEQVKAIASEIERINSQLKEQLEMGQKQLNNLQNTWTGKAADDTRAAFNSFSAKYFQTYYDVIQQYVTFLRRNVSETWERVETANISLADAFK